MINFDIRSFAAGFGLCLLLFGGYKAYEIWHYRLIYQLEAKRFWEESYKEGFFDEVSSLDKETNFINTILQPSGGQLRNPESKRICQGSKFNTVPW